MSRKKQKPNKKNSFRGSDSWSDGLEIVQITNLWYIFIVNGFDSELAVGDRIYTKLNYWRLYTNYYYSLCVCVQMSR